MTRAHGVAGTLFPPVTRGVHTCIHSHTCTHGHAHVYTHGRHRHRCMCTCVLTHGHTHSCAHTRRHVLRQEGLLARVYSHTEVSTHTTHTHTHKHTNVNAREDLDTNTSFKPHCPWSLRPGWQPHIAPCHPAALPALTARARGCHPGCSSPAVEGPPPGTGSGSSRPSGGNSRPPATPRTGPQPGKAG